MGGWVFGRIDVRGVNRWVGEWMDGWVGARMDGSLFICKAYDSLLLLREVLLCFFPIVINIDQLSSCMAQ